MNYYDPTPSEMERYLSMYSPSWGEQLARENSTRILLLGGSISAGCCCSEGLFYATLLAEYISQFENSYVINKSVFGSRPYTFIGEVYDFELWPKDRWPNTVIIELAVNSAVSWSTVKELDNLIFLLNEKWLQNSLPIPDVLLIEFFDVRSVVDNFQGEDTREKRHKYLSSSNERAVPFNRGGGSQIYIDAFARFYSYTVLSVTDVLWPAFCRFFIENPATPYSNSLPKNTSLSWPYTHEGIHPSCLGHKFIADNIVTRFFREKIFEQTRPFIPITPYDNALKDMRMFPVSSYTLVMKKWSLYGYEGGRSNIKQFSSILHPRSNWKSTFVDNGHHKFHDGHDCYGSSGSRNDKSHAIFMLDLPAKCTECIIGLSYIHSWNTSFIGSVNCMLLRDENSMMETIKINGFIHQGVAPTGTYPLETRFSTPLQSGNYTVKCAKLDNKFSCFSQVAVYLK